MSAPVEDSWSQWEFPALVAIHQAFEAEPDGSMLSTPGVLQALDPSGDHEAKWGRAIDRLEQHQYIEASRAMWGRPYPFSITRLTERGLRAVGAWPSESNPVAVLVQVLNMQADEVADKEPEKASRLRKVAAAMGSAVEDVTAETIARFMAKLASGQLG